MEAPHNDGWFGDCTDLPEEVPLRAVLSSECQSTREKLIRVHEQVVARMERRLRGEGTEGGSASASVSVPADSELASEVARAMGVVGFILDSARPGSFVGQYVYAFKERYSTRLPGLVSAVMGELEIEDEEAIDLSAALSDGDQQQSSAAMHKATAAAAAGTVAQQKRDLEDAKAGEHKAGVKRTNKALEDAERRLRGMKQKATATGQFSKGLRDPENAFRMIVVPSQPQQLKPKPTPPPAKQQQKPQPKVAPKKSKIGW